jgi:hypothetical protein
VIGGSRLETHFDLARDFIAYLAKEALDRG